MPFSTGFWLFHQHAFFCLLHFSYGLLYCCNETLPFGEPFSGSQCHLVCVSKDLPSRKECLEKCEVENALTVNNISENNLFYNNTDLTPPDIMCQELVYFKETIVGKVVLFWSFSLSQNVEQMIPLFILEAQKEGNQSEWNVLGVTHHTIEEIVGLEPDTRYQFRIHAVVASEVLLGPVSSQWILVLGGEAVLDAVSNVSAVGFRSGSPFVDALIEWKPPEGLPCSYKIFWFPSFGGEFFDQKTITLPQDKLPTVLPDLTFQTNYSVEVIPFDITEDWTTFKSRSWFITPSCIDANGRNFSLCLPGPPRYLEAYWINETFAVVTWSLPEHTSVENVLQYSITVSKEDVSDKDHIAPIDYSFLVPGNVTRASLSDLHSQNKYFIEVCVVNEGGFGGAAKIQLMKKTEQSVERNPNSTSFGISVSLVLLFSFVVIVPLTCWRCRRLKKKVSFEEGSTAYPSNAQESDPYLLSYEQVTLLDVLGNGAFGIVHKGVVTWKKRKEIAAVKVFLSPVTEGSKYQLLREVELMKIVGRHRHIVGMLGCCIDGPRLCLLLEYCPYGDLLTFLVNLRSKLKSSSSDSYAIPKNDGESDPQKVQDVTDSVTISLPDTGAGKEIITEKTVSQLLSYMFQVALGMDHISSLKLVHRDIAARNILLFTENIVKIGDFGLMRDVYEDKTYSMIHQKRLPVRWMSVESISQQIFTMWSDVWSYGILMWEVITLGIIPYPDLGNEEILPFLNSNQRLPQTELCSQELYDLMLSCWNTMPTNRPTFQDLCHKLEHTLATRNSYLQLECA